MKEEQTMLFLVWETHKDRWTLHDDTPFAYSIIQAEGWITRIRILDITRPTDHEFWEALCNASVTIGFSKERNDEH